MFNRATLTTKEPLKTHRISCYIFEAKLRNTQGDAGWRCGRVWSWNAFQAVNTLSLEGSISEIYFFKRIRGSCDSIKANTIFFDDEI
jgi:hypothetical protein